MAEPKSAPRPEAGPAPHPGPPAHLHSLHLPITRTRGPWVRLHDCGRQATFFRQTGRNRFDAPAGEYGVLYAAENAFCAFIEVFGDPLDLRLVSRRDLSKKCLSGVSAKRPLWLVDLRGEGLRSIHADARLTSGPHDVARQWTVALWSHPDQPDGLTYRARHDPSREAVAIFDRAKTAVAAKTMRPLTGDETLLSRILDHCGFGLVE
ncbi:MAG: RES family NAD+ phosphorylase [Armatimonadetes bacterium]|nr:RES family NAD+ phosphorylase [Armatimonadota bacterium]